MYARAQRGVYNASKWAITGFTKSLQEELAPLGIGVTGVYPGKLRTDLFKKAGNDKDMTDALDPLEVAKAIEYILAAPDTTWFPEIGMMYLAG